MIGAFIQLNTDSPMARHFPIGYVLDGNGCWEWVGGRSSVGYGMWKSVLVHRLLYERTYGPIPDGYEFHHLCNNRGCVNPNHLQVVQRLTHPGNIVAINVNKVTCPRGHPYDAANTRIRRGGARTCRQCDREWMRAYRLRKRGQA